MKAIEKMKPPFLQLRLAGNQSPKPIKKKWISRNRNQGRRHQVSQIKRSKTPQSISWIRVPLIRHPERRGLQKSNGLQFLKTAKKE
ncbi:OLC1v1023844C1, partial [Oldenlandia corymbosa var. corymbosa]